MLHQQQFRRSLEDRQARLLAARPPAPRRHLAGLAVITGVHWLH